MKQQNAVEIGDIVNVRDFDNKYTKTQVVEIIKSKTNDPLIGCSGKGVIGTAFYPQSSITWDNEKNEFFEIADEEAIRRGYRKWER